MRTISSVTLILLALSPVLASGQGTAFTYQGRLTDKGQLADGLYDLRFTMFDASSGGSRQGSPFITNGVPVSNGWFEVTLDFGDVFPGDDRWLQIFVRTNLATVGHTILSPRQKITPRPYAITAGNLSGTLPASQLSGTIPLAQLSGAVVTNNQSGVNFTGTFSGDGAGLTGVVPGTKYQLINGVFTNISYNTNVVYMTGGGSAIVNHAFHWDPAKSLYTNAVNDVVLAQAAQWQCSNIVGRYYRCFPLSFFPGVWGTNNCIGSYPPPIGYYGTNETYRTNQATSYDAPFAINDYKSKESFVTTLGNDSTAKRGSRQFPFATLNAAATNMMPGDVLRIDAGNYYVANAVFPANVAMIGSGRGITVITVASSANTGFGVFMSGGGFVADATFQTTNQPAQPNLQLPLHWEGSGIARNIEVFGDYDALYGVGGSNSTNRFYDCSFFSAFDVFLTAPTGTNVHYELYDCYIKASKGYRGSVSPGVNIQGIVVRQGSGSVNMYGGSIVVENGTTDTLGVLADPGSSHVVNLYDVSVCASSTNGGTVLEYTNRGNTSINLIRGGVTNGVYQSVYLATNAMSSWPASASTPGGFALVNSNGIPFFLLSSPGSTAWTATNRADRP